MCARGVHRLRHAKWGIPYDGWSDHVRAQTMCGGVQVVQGREGCAADDGDVRGRATICRVRGPWAEQSKQAAMFLDVTVSFA